MRQPNKPQNRAERAANADGGGGPRKADAAPAQRQQDRHRGGDKQQGAEKVELVRPFVTGKAFQTPVGDEKRQQSERDIDPEDHRPMEVLGKKPAKHRPGEARRHEHAGEINLIAAPFAGRNQIGHDGLREGNKMQPTK